MRRFLVVCLFSFLILSPIVYCQQDEAEGEEEESDDDSTVQQEDEAEAEAEEADEGDDIVTQKTDDKDLEDEEDETKPLKPNENAEALILFTKPISPKELATGALVKFLVSFFNKGEKDFTVKWIETSFRYPMDFSYHIQNYSNAQINRVVEANHEATFDYSFVPAEGFAGRPLGLVVNLRYEDAEGKQYENAVFNETVMIVEDESPFNPETGFLYVFFACIVVLLLVLGQQFLSKMRRKHGIAKKSTAPAVEVGTAQNKNQVDFEWIPREVLKAEQNKSPNSSPGRSPRNRKGAKKVN